MLQYTQMKKNIFLFLLASFLFIFPITVFAQDTTNHDAATRTVEGNRTIKEEKIVDEAIDKFDTDRTQGLEIYLGGDNKETLGVWDILQVNAFKSLRGDRDAEGNIVTDGALGTTSKMISAIFENPAASSQLYIADLMNDMNIAQPAYAQGLGFTSLSPLLEGWKIFRNLAYLFFVLIFLVIGFLIMMRKKVGQAAITAQQAIPKIIVAMIAVTFSYAIAGLLIDIMYLSMYLIIGLFGDSFGGKVGVGSSIFDIGKYMFDQAGTGSKIVGEFVENVTEEVVDVPEWIAEITTALIIAIAAVFAVFKLFFELLKTYVTIILTIVLSPLQLMLEAIPGQKHFGKWVQGLIGNLAAFPTVLMVLVIYKVLIDQTTGSAGGFMPPFLISGSGTGDVANFLIGFGLLLGLPEAVKQVKKALGASDGGAFGTVLKSGASQSTAGVPLTSRLLGAVGGGAGGAAIGGVGKVIQDIPYVRYAASTGNYGEAVKSIGRSAFQGAGRGVKIGVNPDGTPRMLGGTRRGASAGVTQTAKVNRWAGMNQPDILNPVTGYIDRNLASEEERKKQESRARGEDVLDLLKKMRGE